MQTAFDEYFYPIFGSGVLVATVLSLYAGKARGWLLPLFCLVVGIFAFWGTLFVGSEIGYQKWQSIPNPPDEAFADTFPLGALLAGWLPGSVYCGFLFGIMRLCLLLIPKRNSINAPTPSSTVRTESGNPYQGP